MEDVFEKAFNKVIELEGGFTLHKNKTEEDITYAGIYRKAHPNWEGWNYIDRGEIPPTNLVREFYYKNFWKHFDYSEIDNNIKTFLFDTAVNLGVRQTIKLLQKAINTVPDGIIGSKTLEAVKNSNPDILIKDLLILRIAFYLQLANKNPKKYSIYLRGWLNRTFSFGV